jgi:plastocyanin
MLIGVADGSHTTTSDPGQAESWDAPLDAGTPYFRKQFNVPGFYTYYCTPHAQLGMVASVTVLPVVEIEVRNYEFSPSRIVIQQGDAVRWIWTGTAYYLSCTMCHKKKVISL